MSGGDIQGSSEEDVDIYKDIGDFRLDKELAKLEEINKTHTQDIARLTQRLEELTERNETLQNINEILATNISILLKTAKAEIDRKQLVIDEFRKKIEGQSQHRHGGYERNKFQKLESSKNCSSEDNCKKSEVEEGEIVQDDSEEKDINSELGKRSDSSHRDRRYRTDNQNTNRNSHEKLRSRANDVRTSRQKSRSKESYSRHSSSSRSHYRSISPDLRRHSSSRARSGDKSRQSSRSRYCYRSRSRKTEKSPYRKEESSRSRERHRSVSRKDFERSRKECLTDRVIKEKTSKTECTRGIKSEIVKARKDEKQEEIQENSKTNKTLLIAEEYHLKRTIDGSSEKKTDLASRQSVLADLYDEPAASKTYPEIPKDMSGERIAIIPQNDGGEEDSDWPDDLDWNQWKNKEREPVQRPKTLYSCRMEAKFQQQQRLQDAFSQEHKENSGEKQEIVENQIVQEEIPEKTAENDIQVNNIREEEEVTEKKDIGDNFEVKKEVMKTNCTGELTKEIESESVQKTVEVDLEQSFGDTLIKKLLQLQTVEENVGINVFSPLKNNYKLSKISPLKPVPKQHILEYYNLKPSTQQLNIMESEVLDISLSLPETPGKNFFNSFLPLNDIEDRFPKNDNRDGKCTEINSDVENLRVVDAKNSVEGGMNDIITTPRSNKSKTKNCKSTKMNSTENKMSAELKKLSQTSDDEGGQGKSYKTRYQMRTRSKTENEKINPNEEENSDRKQDGNNKNGPEEEGRLKRDRRLTLTEEEEEEEEDLGPESKRIKLETIKTDNEISIDVTAEGPNITEDITSFDVYMSVTDGTSGDVNTLIQETGRVEEKSEDPTWNGDDSTINKNSNEDETADTTVDKERQSFSSTGNSADSLNFKVLRSYRMLSVNDDTDDDAFGSDSSFTGSEDYSDSGASALVDLL